MPAREPREAPVLTNCEKTQGRDIDESAYGEGVRTRKRVCCASAVVLRARVLCTMLRCGRMHTCFGLLAENMRAFYRISEQAGSMRGIHAEYYRCKIVVAK